MTKKLFIPFILLMMFAITACASQTASKQQPSSAPNASASANTSDSAKSDGKDAGAMINYASETGTVQVPAAPKRIVALTNAPNVLALGGTLVGVDEWTNKNPLFTDKLKGVAVVSEDDLEKIIEQQPDLIIAGAQTKNIEKLKQIAPTVVYTWGKLDYLAQQLEIGKLLNKEKDAQKWVDDFKQRATTIGNKVKAKIGENATVSVIETDAKSFYVFGNNWARGTELLYQAMGLKMPDKVKADALGPGYYTLSQENIASYTGDYMVLSRDASVQNSFMNSETWNHIPAVKNKHVIEIDSNSSSYSDPITLEYLLNIFEKGFLGANS